MKFDAIIDTLKAEVNALKMQGVNKIIAVGHAGYNMDKKIASSVDGLDIIVGGHTDTFLYTGKHVIVMPWVVRLYVEIIHEL